MIARTTYETYELRPQFSHFTLWLWALSALLPALTGCQGAAEPSAAPGSQELLPEAKLTNVAKEWGIHFEDHPRGAAKYDLSAIIGCGCAILDFDRNGLLDILFLAEDSERPNVGLFSQERKGQFRECSTEKGLSVLSGAGIAVGDANNDGWPDLFISSRGTNSLWLNLSGERFRDITSTSGLTSDGWGTSACWLDYDRDGWMDVFLTNYVDYKYRECTRLGGGDADFCTPGLFLPTADKLFRNISGESRDGLIAFQDVSTDSGISQQLTAGLGVTAMDWNEDHWIDIYVASDQHPNLLWINEKGTFREEAALRGCDLDFQGRAQGSMGLALGHFGNDGIEDLVVSNLDGESHAVYCRDGSGFCIDRCRETGIFTATRPYTGFGISAVDVDLDGTDELLTVNGRVKRQDGLPRQEHAFWQPYQQEIQLLKAEKPGGEWKAFAVNGREKHVARGLSTGDLDRDGDPDFVISTTGEPAMVLRNEFVPVQHGITLRFVDSEVGGRCCPGVVFSVENPSTPRLKRTFQPCQSYMSSHADEYYLALPSAESALKLIVNWPHGETRAEEFIITPAESGITVVERGRGSLSN